MKNNSFDKLSGIGTRNSENKMVLETREMNLVGVNVSKEGAGHKPINLTLLVPASRSDSDSRRVLEIKMTGVQARELYTTLENFYATEGARD